MPATTAAAASTLGAVLRKLWLQQRSGDSPFDSAIAVATRPLLIAKYGTAAAISGSTADTDGPSGTPPRAAQTRPAVRTASTTVAMLNAVRYHGCGRRTLTAHCATTPTAAMTIARSAPAVTMTAKSTTYAIDMVECPLPNGRRSLNSETTIIAARNVAASSGCDSSRGAKVPRTSAPAAMTAPM